MISFHLRDFVQMASDKPFNYYSGSWMFLSRIILSQTCSKLSKNDSSEDSEEDDHLEKRHSVGLVKDAKTVVKSVVRVFSLPPISSQTE